MKEALHILDIIDQQSMRARLEAYVYLLQGCINRKALAEGKWVHAHILKSGFKLNTYLGNTLVNMYVKCGAMVDARQTFNKVKERNVFTWTILIGGYVQNGQDEEALELFHQMREQGVKPDKVTFISILKACANVAALEQGKQIHAFIIQNSFESDAFIGSTLIGMYAKCGSIEHARQVFDGMHKRDVVSWNAMIAGYAQQGEGEEALRLFQQMKQMGMKPNGVTFVSILKACGSVAALEWGEKIHAYVIETGFESDIFVGNALVDMYAKCGSIKHARQVFNLMHKRDLISWNAIIAGYGQQGQIEESLELFYLMEVGGIKPDWVTFASMLKACATVGTLERGKQIHAIIVKNGYASDVRVGNTLVDMYSKCGSINCACQVFSEMPKRDVVSWNAMIAAYVQHGQGEKAIELFHQLELEGIKPNKVTFVNILKACSSIAALEQGKWIHACIMECGLELDLCVGNTLIDMYAKCGKLELARQVFDNIHIRDVVSWNVMISSYVQHGYCLEAFKLFWQMDWEGMKLNEVTFVSILKACAELKSLELGKQIHAHIIKNGFESSDFVNSTLVDMYAKCGAIEYARKLFDKMPKRDVVTWTAMISGYAQHGQGEEALKLFKQMKREERPDKMTFVSMLKACASIAALQEGKQIHSHIIKCGLELDAFVRSALVDMYAKCGNIEHAQKLFDKMPKQDMASWNAIITGYAQHGHGKRALQLVGKMQQEGMKPDQVTSVCILSACSHAGLVDEGYKYFNSMIQVHGITPTDEHFACIVDLLGRAGHLDDAEDFIKKMPIQATAVVWTTLLGACRRYGNMTLAKRAADCLLKMDPQSTAGFVLLSNVYAAAGRWNNKTKLRSSMDGNYVKRSYNRAS